MRIWWSIVDLDGVMLVHMNKLFTYGII